MTEDDPTRDPHVDPAGDPALDPATDAHLRSLLAELGSGPDGDPMPPEIAARLDATLARLAAVPAETAPVSAETAPVSGETAPVSGETARVSAETARVSEEAGSNVVPLRRRRARRTFAAAAAAVVLLGAGGVAVSQLGGLDGSSGGSSADSTTSGSAGSDAGGSASAPESGPDATKGQDGTQDGTQDGAQDDNLPAVRLATFDADATRLLRRAAADRSAIQVPNGRALTGTSATPTPPTPGSPATPTDPSVNDVPPGDAAAVRRAGCTPPRADDGALPSAITLDGRPAVLVVHPDRDGRRLVQAWSCSGERVLASARVAGGG